MPLNQSSARLLRAPLTAAILAMCGTTAFAQDDTATADAQPAASSSTAASSGSEPAPMPETSAEDGWQVSVTPYLWLAAMNGDIGFRGRDASVDQDLGDVIDILKDSFNIGGAVHLEVENGKWGFFVDASYMDLRAEDNTRIGTTIDAQLQQFIGELGGFYSVIRQKPDGAKPAWRIDLLGGVRFTWMSVEIDPDNFDSRDREKGWVDPFIGARVACQITDWCSLGVRGDIGGFGIDPGTTSDLTWNVMAGADFQLSKSMSVMLGYRWLDYDYHDGDGRDEFSFDMTLSGPYFGGTIRF